MCQEMQSIKALDIDQLTTRLAELGEPGYRARQILEWIYTRRVQGFSEMSNLPAALRQRLSNEFDNSPLVVVEKTGSSDTTQKFLFQLSDRQLVETVLIPASPALYGGAADRRTLCVSSQVGCAYGCKFCASGLDGWKRNLDAGEIVEQLLAVEAASGERVNNIVFMGMGEPLANYENLMHAISIINAPWGGGIGARHITVSTSGLVPRIMELAEQPLQIRLAISLHGATDSVRDQIMPVNRKYPLADLLDACDYFKARKKQKITFEYILIQGVNDSEDDARELAKITRRLEAKVNVIPYNSVDGLAWERPSEADQDAFMAVLRRGAASATIRREKGHDIAAACGQLRLRTERKIPVAAEGCAN